MNEPAQLKGSTQLTETEREGLERMAVFNNSGRGYAVTHATRPSTIALVLTSNPLAMLAWIGEKFLEWSGEDIPIDTILESVTLYWLTETLPTSLYTYRALGAEPQLDQISALNGTKPRGSGISRFGILSMAIVFTIGLMPLSMLREFSTGLHDFEGKLMHSACWDVAYDMRGNTVAVIGSGSSGVQIIPALQPHVKSLITFISSPTWITAGTKSYNQLDDETQRKWLFEGRKAYLDYRKDMKSELNRRFNILLKDTPEQAAAKDFSKTEMEMRVQKDARLVKTLIPDFPVGCRRSYPGNAYLEALVAPNMMIVTDAIERITKTSMILSTGEHVEFDALVCATGFDVSFRPRFPIMGRGGVSLEQHWTEGLPQAYLSLAVELFPNYFDFLGPNCPIGHGSVVPIAEHAAKYMINMLQKMQTQNTKTFVPKADAVRDFNEHISAFMERTVWSAKCRSWYKNGMTDGPVVGLHPGSRIHWFHVLDDPRYEDYEFSYWTISRFQYLGNGFSTREAEDRDSSYYLDQPWAGIRSY
ncbi:hypothetical protein AYO22_11714 [Fonsecaea multimorphosa]|nr:hypothetical protein AYO22_11714 [Fonsecaea multimorphosa]